MSRLNSDIQVIQDTLSTNISMFVRGTLFILVVIILLCFISLPLMGVVFCAIIPLIVFMAFFSRYMRTLQKDIWDTKGVMNTTVEESFANKKDLVLVYFVVTWYAHVTSNKSSTEAPESPSP